MLADVKQGVPNVGAAALAEALAAEPVGASKAANAIVNRMISVQVQRAPQARRSVVTMAEPPPFLACIPSRPIQGMVD